MTDLATSLKARLEASVSRITATLEVLTLNDLSDAVTDMDAVEIALAKSRSSWGELFVDVDGHPQLAPFHEEVSESFETFREAIEEGNQRITSMIDDGLADEGNEEHVQRVMEEEVLPPLDSALQEIQDLIP